MTNYTMVLLRVKDKDVIAVYDTSTDKMTSIKTTNQQPENIDNYDGLYAFTKEGFKLITDKNKIEELLYLYKIISD